MQLAAWKQLLLWMGVGLGVLIPVLMFFVIIAVVINVAGSFVLGSFTGISLHEDPGKITQTNANIKQEYQKVAAEWSNGLDAQQQQIVQQYQLDMPYSVLMSVGKFANNYGSKNEQKAAQTYYNELKPTYTWIQGRGETINRHLERTKKGSRVVDSVAYFTVWELTRANVWDGKFIGTYKVETFGSLSPTSGSETIEPVMVSWTTAYDRTRFDNVEKQYKFYGSNQENPLPYEIMYTLQSNLYDPDIQQWSAIYGNQPLPDQVSGGFNLSGPVPTVAVSELKYVSINPQAALSWINAHGYNSFFTVADIQTICDAAKTYDLNPLLLLAITGAEQSFDSINSYGGVVNSGDITDLKEIEANPFNVYNNWMAFHPSLAISADIAARTVASHLTASPPPGEDAILYINDPVHNPTHQIYAQDPNWGSHVRAIFNELVLGLGVQLP